jgi:hypothetical protein
MDEDEVYEMGAGGGYKWRPTLLVIRVLAFIASLFGVTGRLFGGIAEDLIEHTNYTSEREQFVADAGRELEAILEVPEEE